MGSGKAVEICFEKSVSKRQVPLGGKLSKFSLVKPIKQAIVVSIPSFMSLHQTSVENFHLKVYIIARAKNGNSRPKQASSKRENFSKNCRNECFKSVKMQ